MSQPHNKLFYLASETHSIEKIQAALTAGIDVNGHLGGKTPLTLLVEMYLRSPKFSDCVRCLVQAGARCPDAALLAVLLDDAELLAAELRKNPSLIHHRVNIRCAFTPLVGASLPCMSPPRVRPCAGTRPLCSRAGADVEAKAALDDYGFNGHTPVFHTSLPKPQPLPAECYGCCSNTARRRTFACPASPGEKVLNGRRRFLMPRRFPTRKPDYCRSSNVTGQRDVYENIKLLAPRHRAAPCPTNSTCQTSIYVPEKRNIKSPELPGCAGNSIVTVPATSRGVSALRRK